MSIEPDSAATKTADVRRRHTDPFFRTARRVTAFRLLRSSPERSTVAVDACVVFRPSICTAIPSAEHRE